MSSPSNRLISRSYGDPSDDSEEETETDEDVGDKEAEFLKFEEMYAEERDCIRNAQERREADGKFSDAKFALAFSGGGMRAAAFQCGVLWRLAKMNLLKDVEIMTAVSGGGYISMAFASHCVAEEKIEGPRPGEVKQWYERVVAKTVVRMQENAGDFVRDFVRSGPCIPADRSGCCPYLPRVFDIPILIGTLCVTVLVNPGIFFLALLIPFVIITNHYFGADMRDIFCRPNATAFQDTLQYPNEFANVDCLLHVTLGMVVAAVVVMIVCPADPLKKTKASIGEFVEHGPFFLMGHGLRAFLIRTSGFLCLYVLFLATTLGTQINFFSHKHGSPDLLSNYCPGGANFGKESCLVSELGCMPAMSSRICGALFLAFLAAVILMPYVGSGMVIDFACVSGPFFVILFVLRMTQYRIFGEFTGQDFLWHQTFSLEKWNHQVYWALLAAVVLLPLYNSIRSVLHVYYERCLIHCFFADAKDRPFCEMKRSAYCPFQIVTGTSSDYKAPCAGDGEDINELSFSSLHCGSPGLGYVPQPEYRTMGKCVALTAAGCIDAVALTLSKLLTLRFWLEVLNLSWGDFIMFSPQKMEDTCGIPAVGGGIMSCIKATLPRFMHAWAYKNVDRLPSTLAVTAVWFSIFWAFKEGKPEFYGYALILFLIIFGLSFFPLCCLNDEIAQSPWLRQLQQLTGYTYRGNKPPPMLYITDGGCRDCTTLRQLVMRRQERILMVLAACDATDELGVLKNAIQIAIDSELCSFFDPTDPRRDLRYLFKEYKDDKSISLLHIGIRYNPTSRGANDAKTGHLYIVKNRLPDHQEGHAVEPHLTVEEMCGECDRWEGPAPFDPAWEDLTTDQLGSFGCCDCCHTTGCGNCGPKFPHGSFANFMYMTPMWCNSLARLGFDVSEEAVLAATKTGSRMTAWEQSIPPRESAMA